MSKTRTRRVSDLKTQVDTHEVVARLRHHAAKLHLRRVAKRLSDHPEAAQAVLNAKHSTAAAAILQEVFAGEQSLIRSMCKWYDDIAFNLNETPSDPAAAAAEIAQVPERDILNAHRRAEHFCKRFKPPMQVSDRNGREFKQYYNVLSEPLQVVTLPGSDAIDMMADRLVREFPWMNSVTERVWRHLKAKTEANEDVVPLPPLLLTGPPGSGKTSYATALAAELGMPCRQCDAAQAGAAFRIAGVERGWSSAMPGLPVSAMVNERCATPMVIVDEIDKCASARSENNERSSLADALLALLEPQTSRRWLCPALQIPLDMSGVSWILTANNTAPIAAPLQSRVEVFHIPQLDQSALLAALGTEATKRYPDDAALICKIAKKNGFGTRGETLRDVRRILDKLMPQSNRRLH